MVKGQLLQQKRDVLLKPQVNYRKLDALNCSMIKLFDSDPVRFFEQFKLGKDRKENRGVSIAIGDIVDFYLLDCGGDENTFNNRFDEKFALNNLPTDSKQVYELARVVFELTVADMDPVTKEISSTFEERFSNACDIVQRQGSYKGKKEEKILEDFNENGLDYFQTLVDNMGKKVVTVSLLDKAKKVAENLKTDEFTTDLFVDGNDDIEYFSKFPIEWIHFTKDDRSIECKSELDMLRIDHSRKTIYPQDLKTTYDNESFEFAYIKHKYYLQAAFYHLAVRYWADQNGMKDYEIKPMEFIVGDTSSNNRRPIRYTLSTDDLDRCLNGFKLRGEYHKGILELLEEICWAEITDNWNASKQVIDNNGILKLGLNYE